MKLHDFGSGSPKLRGTFFLGGGGGVPSNGDSAPYRGV